MINEEIVKHPIKILAEDIIKFTLDIECLHTTLPLLMNIMGATNKKIHDEFHTYLEKKC